MNKEITQNNKLNVKLVNVRVHYCFRNNEMQSEVSRSELDLTMGMRLDMQRNGNFQLQLLTVTKFAY